MPANTKVSIKANPDDAKAHLATTTDLKSQVTNHRTVHVEHNGPVIIVRLQYQLATQHMNICEVPGLRIVFEIGFLAQCDLGSDVQTPAKVCLALMHVYCTLVNLKGEKKEVLSKQLYLFQKASQGELGKLLH
jgi:hypothetical protein